MKAIYIGCCVNWPPDDVWVSGGLSDMIDQQLSITRRTFCKNVDRQSREDLERDFGYAPHDKDAVLTMASDYLVSYAKSKLHGETVYFINHSAIEYVFQSP